MIKAVLFFKSKTQKEVFMEIFEKIIDASIDKEKQMPRNKLNQSNSKKNKVKI
jgi:hypothetical protein